MNIDYNEVINRMGYFRFRAKLTGREASLRLGYTEQFISRIENKSFQLKVSTLLDFLEMVEITPQEFFYLGEEYSKDDVNLLEMFSNLSAENKTTIVDLMKKLK